jgi:hypothetical protein
VACAVYKYRVDLSDKEKQLLRQAKKKRRKDARLVLRILMIMLANGMAHLPPMMARQESHKTTSRPKIAPRTLRRRRSGGADVGRLFIRSLSHVFPFFS